MLLGETRGGNPLSLLGCALLETRGVHGGLPTSQLISVDRVLDGVALTRADQNTFLGVIVQIDTLTAWLHSALVSDDLHDDRSWPTVDVPATNHRPSVVLRRHPSVQAVSTPHHTGRLVTDMCDLQLDFPEPVDVSTALAMVETLAQLVSTAALRICRPLQVVLLAEDGASPRLYTAETGSTHLDPPLFHDYLLPADSAGPLVAAWLNAPQKKGTSSLRQAAYAAAEVLGRRDLSAGLRLNRAVSAAESLYRHLEAAVSIPPPHDQADHDRVMAAALDNLSSEDAGYLRRRLLDNTRSMKMQLDEIAKLLPPDVSDWLCPPSWSWSKAATSGRSRAAHGTSDDNQHPDAVLAYLTAITVLVVVCDQLGVPRTVDQLRQITPLRRSRALIWAADTQSGK